MTEPDAILRVFDARQRLDRKIIGWRWTDGRRTMSPTEHDECARVTEEAEEERVDVEELDHGTVVARIWMDDEEIDRIEWDGS